ncbi:MAG: ribose 5-phosphate isomerase B [Planctomycetota bacterium]|nr:MAG: ribose 5-phosphate isomerase B [Planctomycetota bacterium]
MRIAIASDHAGYRYKCLIIDHLQARGHKVNDHGTDSDESCDYPDYIRPAALAVAKGEADRAIVLGGSGNGEAIVANRVPGVRCALAFSEDTAIWGRSHNDANCLAIGERTVSPELCLRIVDLWLDTAFEGGRHQRRIEKIDAPSSASPA